MRSVWNGTITFGLAAIPVKAYAATEDRGSGLHQIHTTDGGRVRLRRICELDGADVPFAELGRGVQLPDGDVVPLSQADLAGLPSASSHAIEVRAFTPFSQIDPLYFDRSYYLAPEPAGAQPYALLAEALCQSVRVAVVTVALRQRETLAMVRERDGVLVLTTLHWPDQVRTPDFPVLTESVSRRAVRSAVADIARLSQDFSPAEYSDGYRAALRDLVDARVSAGEVLRPTAALQEAGSESLVSALRDRASGAASGDAGAAAVAQARAAERKAARKAATARAAAARASRRSRVRR